jgi:hypothetical protein
VDFWLFSVNQPLLLENEPLRPLAKLLIELNKVLVCADEPLVRTAKLLVRTSQ